MAATILSTINSRRAPNKDYALVSKHYKKKLATPESDESIRIVTKKMINEATVRDFFLRDDNQRPAPGIHEVITKSKKKMRKRYLTDTIFNLYLKFCDEFGYIISRSTFYKLKPFWVLRLKITDHDTTACREHENFQFLFEKLQFHRVVSAPNLKNFIDSACCDYKSKECLYGECKNCNNFNVIFNGDDIVTWYNSWVTEKISRVGAKGMIFKTQVTEKKNICQLSQLVLKFNTNLRKFLIHAYRTNHQYFALSSIKLGLELKPRKVHVVVDFSMNWEGKYCKEIHSTHFGGSKTQTTIHSGAFYYLKTSSEVECQTFCTVSDSLRHDACAVWAHLQPIIAEIKNKVPDLDELSVQSDGPTTQYRNKTNFYLFHKFCSKTNLLEGSWHFTAPGHSKGVGDAAGGNFKEILRRAVCSDTDILCAEDILNFFKTREDKILVFGIKLTDIEEIDKMLLETELGPVKKTMTVSQITWNVNEKSCLKFRYLTCNACDCNKVCEHYNMPESEIDYSEKKINYSSIF